jgi:hypothetical protein
MDGLDEPLLGKARAVLQRCVAHYTSSVDRQVESVPSVSSWAG